MTQTKIKRVEKIIKENNEIYGDLINSLEKAIEFKLNKKIRHKDSLDFFKDDVEIKNEITKWILEIENEIEIYQEIIKKEKNHLERLNEAGIDELENLKGKN